MTREAFSPSPSYPIDGVGPYQITHPYKEGTLVVAVVLDGNRVELLESDYVISPLESLSTGEITLTAQAALDHDAAVLYIRRATKVEQGWLGKSSREKGLEEQLDWLSEAVQDLTTSVDRTVRLDASLPPVAPKPGHVIVWGEDEAFEIGPSAEDIANALPNAQAATAQAEKAKISADQAAQSEANAVSAVGEIGAGMSGFDAAPAIVRGVDTSAEISGSYFGMTGNVTKNTQALLDAAQEFALAKGGSLRVGEGNYSFDEAIVWPSNMQLKLNPKAVIEFGGASGQAAMSWSGTSGMPVAVAGDLIKGALFAPVDPGDQAGFIPGHYAKIVSTETFDPARTATKKGEIIRVRAVSDGVVSFWEPVRDNYLLANGTVTIKPVTMAGKCGIEGGAVIGTQATSPNGLRGLDFRFCENPFTFRTDLGRFDDRCQVWWDCDHPYYGHSKSFDGLPASTGYMFSVANATRGAMIERIVGYNHRHMMSTNNEGAEGGVVRDLWARDLACAWTPNATTGSLGPGDMFDTHAALDGALLERLMSFYARGSAFNFEGRNIKLKDSAAIAPVGRAINANNWTKERGYLVIDGFRGEGLKSGGIYASSGHSANGHTAAANDEVRITDVDLELVAGNSEVPVYIQSQGDRINKVKTHDITVKGAANVNGTIWVENAAEWKFGGCDGTNNMGHHLRARDALHISGDLGSPVVLTSKAALYIDAPTLTCQLTGGRPTQAGGGSAYGVRAVAGVGKVTASSVDLEGMSIPYDIPAATVFKTDDTDERSDGIVIVAGVLTGIRAHMGHIAVDTESAAANDNLWEIDTTHMYQGQPVILTAASSLRLVTVKDAGTAGGEGTPNIRLSGNADKVLGVGPDPVMLINIGGVLIQVAFSDN